MQTKVAQKHREFRYYPLISPEKKTALWKRARGVWRGRTTDPVRELEKMREEWERAPL